MADITVYGANWCPDCRRAKRFLGEHRVPYEWVDVDEHPEAKSFVEKRNNGAAIIPTIVFADGSHLAEPSNEELATKLEIRLRADWMRSTSRSAAAARPASRPRSTPPAKASTRW